MSQLPSDEELLEATDSPCECNSGIGAYKVCSINIEESLKQVGEKYIVKLLKEDFYKKTELYIEDATKWEKLIVSLISNFSVRQIGLLLHSVIQSR